MEERLIILYDGYCNLCSHSVQWIIRNDRRARFTYKALQEEGHPGIPEEANDTVQLLMAGKKFERSTAALMIVVRLRFPWPLLGFLFIVPPFIRDGFYKMLARNRKRWFGERSTCYIP